MNSITTSVIVEDLKIRRSKVFPFMILASIFFSIMIGVLMFIALHPELANSSSLVNAKIAFFKETTWNSYFIVLLQMIPVLGIILFGFLITWSFGREYSDRTIKDLLALPISRNSIVLSKFLIISVWSIILSIFSFISSIIVGLLLNISGWSNELTLHVFYIYMMTAFFAMLVTTPVAFVASAGKGYLAPLAYIISTVMLSQFINIGLPGLDPYTPWIIPVVYATSSLTPNSTLPSLNIVSYVILIGTCLIGIVGTLYWWYSKDHF